VDLCVHVELKRRRKKNEEIERVEQKQSKREKWNRKIWKDKMGCQ
jgi:hypothetical protein